MSDINRLVQIVQEQENTIYELTKIVQSQSRTITELSNPVQNTALENEEASHESIQESLNRLREDITGVRGRFIARSRANKKTCLPDGAELY